MLSVGRRRFVQLQIFKSRMNSQQQLARKVSKN